MPTNQQPPISGADPNAPSNTGSTGNPTPTSQPAPAPKAAPAGADLGILGHIAIHALAGAVRGIQAQQAPRPTSDDASASGAADEPVAQAPADTTANATPNPRAHSQPIDRRTLAMAQVQARALQNLKLAHDISQAKKADPSRLPALETQARSAQLPVLARVGVLGLKKIASHVTSYQEANEMNLAKKLARGQIVPLVNPDGGVDVYELPADAAYAPTTKPLEIRKPIGLDPDGNVRWETVGVVPPGSMTKAEGLSQVALPEQKAAAELIRTAMTARGSQ